MSQPPVPLSPAQQQDLVQRIGQACASAVPPGWRQLRVEYRAVGRHVEADVVTTAPDGRDYPARPHPEAVRLLAVLRGGMYRRGRGTWLSATLVFTPQHPPRLDFRPDVEPLWRRPPPQLGFQDELRFFPRSDAFIPPWLRTRAGLPPLPAPWTPDTPPPPSPPDRAPTPHGGPAAAPPPATPPLPADAPATPRQAAAAATGADAAPSPPPENNASAPLPTDGGEEPAIRQEDLSAPVPATEDSAPLPSDTAVPTPEAAAAPEESAGPVATVEPGVADPPATTVAGMRTPRVYDGLDEAGRPVVEREALAEAERERVLAYLESAPAVLASRSFDVDAFDPGRVDVVPLTFRTDGSWVWPGAVAYYLREHAVAPDPELLSHIRGRRFEVPEVGEPARQLALAAVTGEPPVH